jgi:hypothetical protein
LLLKLRVKYLVYLMTYRLKRGVLMPLRLSQITLLLLLVFMMLIQCISIIGSTSELNEQGNIALNLIYEARVVLTVEGSLIEEILGLNPQIINSITITVDYTVYVNLTLNTYLEVEGCDLALNIERVSVAPSEIPSDFIQSIKNIEKSTINVENACNTKDHSFQALPLLVTFNRGNITIERTPEELYFEGLLQFDIDIAQSTLETIVQTSETTNLTVKILNYEPLSGIPLLYSETTVYSNSLENKKYTYYAYIKLDRSSISTIAYYLARSVSQFEFQGNTTYPPISVIVLYPANNIITNISTRGSTITVSFSNFTRCFIQIGPIPLKLEVNSDITLKYYVIMGGMVFYTPKPVNCSQVNIHLSNPVKQLPVSDRPKLGLPPQHPPPSSTEIMGSFLVIFLAMVISYLIIDKLVNIFTKHSAVI